MCVVLLVNILIACVRLSRATLAPLLALLLSRAKLNFRYLSTRFLLCLHCKVYFSAAKVHFYFDIYKFFTQKNVFFVVFLHISMY